MSRSYRELDVFASGPLSGNPLAVVHDADGLSTEEMQRFANWTNFSETTFLVPPTSPEADYSVRIFTPDVELPFAGHPTLGTCHAWLEAGGVPTGELVMQECGVGLVPIRRTGAGLAFAAPPLMRSGSVGEDDAERFLGMLGLDRADVVDLAWIDNGPGWVGVLLPSADDVLAVELDPGTDRHFDIGIVGPHPPGSDVAIEVRAFFCAGGTPAEDPVTGSLQASVAQWLLGEGRLEAPYVAAQGTRLGRAGRARIDLDDEGAIWVGGQTATTVTGTVVL
ncbi:MAG: PhzF family phenazine biosynthesis protein [Actinomycetota bacterium]